MTAVPTEGNEIEIKAAVVFDFISFRKKKQRVMTDIKEEPLDYDAIQKIPGIVGYIVKEGDSLWSIAKIILLQWRAFRSKTEEWKR